MYNEVNVLTLRMTFHYLNGQSESFNVIYGTDGTTEQDLRQEIRRFLAQDWWVLKLVDGTVFIKASNVLKFEIKPPLDALEGEGVLSNAERVTALTR